MKNLITPLGMILIMLSHGACRTSKFSDRQVNRTAALEQTDTRIREQENKQYSRVHTITDSTGQVYQVTIYPVDSFQFSTEKGFRGKASKVELSGLINQVKRMNDSSGFIVSARRETDAKNMGKVIATQRGNSKSVEKTGFNGRRLCVAGGLILLIVWIWRRAIRFLFL